MENTAQKATKANKYAKFTKENGGAYPEKKVGSLSLRRDQALNDILKGKSPHKSLLDAGYSKYYAEQPGVFFKGKQVQDRLRERIDELSYERDQALSAMKGKREGASYSDLTGAVEKLTKLTQLLEGNPTERVEIEEIAQGIRDIASR